MARPISHWGDIEDEAQAGSALVAAARKKLNGITSRKQRACELLSQYEGVQLNRFDAAAYDGAEAYDFVDVDKDGNKGDPWDLTHNYGARVMDAIDAKIFALDRTKTQFLVSDGGWKVKAAAVKAGRFIEGVMSEQCGLFKDHWEAWRHAGRLTTVATGAALMFWWSDPSVNKIVAELDDTLNVWVETGGLPYDGWTAIGRITYWEPRKLAARFPEHRDAILAAASDPKMVTKWRELYSEDEDEEADDQLRVPFIQGWRMQYGDPENGGVKGVQMACIPDRVLDRRDYDSPDPPCVRMCPMPQLAGVWGRTIFEKTGAAVRRYNEILSSCDDAERLHPKGSVTFDPTATDEATLKASMGENVVLIPHTGPMDRRPVYDAPAPFHPVVLELLRLHKDAIFDLPGMNEAHATMALGKGLSGVAIRLLKQEVYEIFAPLEDEMTRCSGPESAKQIIRCAKELQKHGGFTARWKGGKKGGWLQEIGADVFDILDDHAYRVEAQAVSGTTNTFADNIELAKELVQMQIISGEAYADMIRTGYVFGATGSELSQAEEEFIEKQIDDWMYADLETARERYMAPEVWMDKGYGLTLKVGAAYLRARMDMINDMHDAEVTARLGIFKTFMSQLAANAQQRQMMAAQVQATAQGQMQAPPA